MRPARPARIARSARRMRSPKLAMALLEIETLLGDQHDLFAVGGALAVALAVSSWTAGAHDESFEFRTYVACGLALAALALWRWFFRPLAGKFAGADRVLLAALKVAGLAAGAWLIFDRLTWISAAGAALEAVAIWLCLKKTKGKLQLIFIAAVAFSCAPSLIWWQPFAAFLGATWWAAPIGAVVIGLAAVALFRAPTANPRGARYLFKAALLAPSAVFAFLGATWATVHFHDEGFWVGAIQLVRGGGRLLWDVPSQYGFLSILFPSCLPFASAWQAMWAACSLFLLMSLALTYVLSNAALPAVSGAALSAFLTPALVLLVPGWAPELGGANGLPSVGPYRFIWVPLIVALFAADAAKPRRGSPYWIAAIAVWCLSCFWSFEALTFVHRFRRRFSRTAASERSGEAPLGAVGLDPLDLASSRPIGRVRGDRAGLFLSMGRFPDWSASLGICARLPAGLRLASGQSSRRLPALALLFAAICCIRIQLAAEARQPMGVAAAAMASAWAVCSYFVGRSHDNNILNLLPTLLGVAFALLAFHRMARLSDSAPLSPSQSRADPDSGHRLRQRLRQFPYRNLGNLGRFGTRPLEPVSDLSTG